MNRSGISDQDRWASFLHAATACVNAAYDTDGGGPGSTVAGFLGQHETFAHAG